MKNPSKLAFVTVWLMVAVCSLLASQPAPGVFAAHRAADRFAPMDGSGEWVMDWTRE